LLGLDGSAAATHVGRWLGKRPSPVIVRRFFLGCFSFSVSGRGLVLVGLWVIAVAAQWGALRPVVSGEHVGPAVILYHLVGASFAACGLLAWYRRPHGRTGRLMVLTGFLFFARPLLSRVDWSLAQTMGVAVGNLWVVTFVALLVSFPDRPRRRVFSERVLIGAFVLAEGVLVLAWMMFAAFPGNLLLVSVQPAIAEELNRAAGLIGFAAALWVAVLLATRWRAATAGGRRMSAPAVAGAVTLVFLSGLLLEGSFTDYQSPFLTWPTLVGLMLVPVVFLGGIWRTWAARAAVADLLVELGAARGAPLEAALANALRDPTLTLAYWLPEFACYVDSGGHMVELPNDSDGRLTAIVEQDGENVAAIVYDASLEEEQKLLGAVIAAAGFALKNERLSAELRARVSELGASRARILDAGDKERRRLERNLHDGAQQRLVALSMQLTLLKARIRDDPASAEKLATKANADLAESLEELRELARGLHPSALDHGLAVALESLGAQSLVSTRVTVELFDRLPEPIEAAVYFVTSEALANVDKHARASRATVRVLRSTRDALVEIADDGIGGANDASGSGLRGLADRVEALEGQLRVVSPAGAGTTVTAVIPCAS
jgi:signal transduction histidine kinase